MRGGVTRKKLLTRRKVADLTREIGLGHGGSLNTRIKEFVRPALTSGSIRGAVRDYIVGGARKQRVVTKYGEISNWDVSNVTNMENMFELEGAVSFNQPLNKWNVSNVKIMYRMFAGARSFNQPLNNWIDARDVAGGPSADAAAHAAPDAAPDTPRGDADQAARRRPMATALRPRSTALD